MSHWNVCQYCAIYFVEVTFLHNLLAHLCDSSPMPDVINVIDFHYIDA